MLEMENVSLDIAPLLVFALDRRDLMTFPI